MFPFPLNWNVGMGQGCRSDRGGGSNVRGLSRTPHFARLSEHIQVLVVAIPWMTVQFYAPWNAPSLRYSNLTQVLSIWGPVIAHNWKFIHELIKLLQVINFSDQILTESNYLDNTGEPTEALLYYLYSPVKKLLALVAGYEWPLQLWLAGVKY